MPRCLSAHHSKGGSISYEYLPNAATQAGFSRYRIRITHYVDCNSVNIELQRRNTYLGIFIGKTDQYYGQENGYYVNRVLEPTPIPAPPLDPCITNAPNVCYYYDYYEMEINLPDNPDGYRLVEQECCRADDIANLENSANTGSTLQTTLLNGNSSPQFTANDMAGVICHNTQMSINLSAPDPDGDQLEYSFTSALDGGVRLDGGYVNLTPLPGPYIPLTYTNGFDAMHPLGANVTLNAQTGIMSGIAPAIVGAYTISFVVSEYRKGVLINQTNREILFTVADCSLHAASLHPTYVNCDGLDFQFSNENKEANITQYVWDFGDGSTPSNEANPQHTYPTEGDYELTLKVVNAGGCNDEAKTQIRVWPGFEPDFAAKDGCFQKPFHIEDRTKAAYGTANGWQWTLGDGISEDKQQFDHNYTTPGQKTITLSVSSDKGCVKSISKTITAFDKPPLNLPFTDSLLCKGEKVLIGMPAVSATSAYQWSPAVYISDPNISNPVLSPIEATDYQVTVNDNGCINSGKVHLGVVDHVTLEMPANISVCLGDPFYVNPDSDGKQFAWTSSNDEMTLNATDILNPQFLPTKDATYTLTAIIGHCSTTKSITVKTNPYAQADAGEGLTICQGQTVQLNGNITGNDYKWLNSKAELIANQTLTPTVRPYLNAYYILMARRNDVCTKWISDTVFYNVIPEISLQTTRDTTANILSRVPLFALANNNSVRYQWTPANNLNADNIANPVAVFNQQGDYRLQVTATTPEGCTTSKSVSIRVFGTGDYIFVPTAFTPNGDGKNDVLVPVLSGITQLKDFSLFDRWGKRVFSTRTAGQGWDGWSNGQIAKPGTYIYFIQALTSQGETISQKGTTVLLR